MAAIIIDEGNPRFAFHYDDFAPGDHRIQDQSKITIQYSVSNNGDETGEVRIRLSEVAGEGLGVIKTQSFPVPPTQGLGQTTPRMSWDVTFSEPGDHRMFVQLEDTSEGGKGKLDEHHFTFTITPAPEEPEPTGPDLFLISGPRIT